MTPNDDSRDEELLARYRRASADAAAPSDAVRAAIIAESRRVADELARRAPATCLRCYRVRRPTIRAGKSRFSARSAPRCSPHCCLRRATGKTLRRFRRKRRRLPRRHRPRRAQAQLRSQAKDEVPKLTEVKPNAAPSFTAPTRQSPGESSSLQEIVVTQANRKKAYAAAAPIAATPAPADRPAWRRNTHLRRLRPSPLAAAQPPAGARLKARDSSLVPQKAIAIAASADLVGRFSAQKPATLESAIAQGDVARAAALLDQGAAIDARDEAGRTPLMLAVTPGPARAGPPAAGARRRSQCRRQRRPHPAAAGNETKLAGCRRVAGASRSSLAPRAGHFLSVIAL